VLSSGAPTEGPFAAGEVSGWVLANGADSCIETTWNPPTWVDETSDVVARIVLAPKAGANTVPMELSYLMLDSHGAPGTLTTAALTDVELDTALSATAKEIQQTGNATIDAAAVDVTDYYPILIKICRDDADPQKVGTADVLVVGLTMNVTRRYVD